MTDSKRPKPPERPIRVGELIACEGCGKTKPLALWFFGLPYCQECKDALMNDPVDVNDL